MPTLEDILKMIRSDSRHTVGDTTLKPTMALCTKAQPAIAWNHSEIESRLSITIPEELRLLWNNVSEVRLLHDAEYGQWGCTLWSPSEVISRHIAAVMCRGVENFLLGDFVVGEFSGDTDLVVLRCNVQERDFCSVVIASATDSRADWPCVARSMFEFIARFLALPGSKFWEPR